MTLRRIFGLLVVQFTLFFPACDHEKSAGSAGSAQSGAGQTSGLAGAADGGSSLGASSGQSAGAGATSAAGQSTGGAGGKNSGHSGDTGNGGTAGKPVVSSGGSAGSPTLGRRCARHSDCANTELCFTQVGDCAQAFCRAIARQCTDGQICDCLQSGDPAKAGFFTECATNTSYGCSPVAPGCLYCPTPP